MTPNIQSPVLLNDPMVLLDLTLRHFGIALLPLYMERWPETGNNLVSVLPRWTAQPVTLCALFSGHSRLTPKVHVLLDFLAEYIGTPVIHDYVALTTRECLLIHASKVERSAHCSSRTQEVDALEHPLSRVWPAYNAYPSNSEDAGRQLTTSFDDAT